MKQQLTAVKENNKRKQEQDKLKEMMRWDLFNTIPVAAHDAIVKILFAEGLMLYNKAAVLGTLTSEVAPSPSTLVPSLQTIARP